MTQPNLFDIHDPLEPHQGGKPEPARLTGQRAKILERLKRGRASNADLHDICFRYSARIHELRKAGYQIRIVGTNRVAGLVWYELK